MMILWLGNLNVVGKRGQWFLGVPALPGRGCLGLWVGTMPLGFLGAVWGPFFVQVLVSWPMRAVLCAHPLQVLHQVLAVAGLPRVPEKHDVWSQVQTLQVRSAG